MRSLLITCAFLVLGTVAQGDSARDQVVRARTHHRAGEILFEGGDYAGALREFDTGYSLAPRPEFLLNIGQVKRKLRNLPGAIDAFEKFLAAVPSADARRAAVEDVLTELRAEKAAEKPARMEPPASAPVVVASLALPPRRHWYMDGVGGTLCGVGLAGIGVGAGLFAVSNATIGNAGLDLDHYNKAADAVPTRIGGLVSMGLGGALFLGGVVRYATYK